MPDLTVMLAAAAADAILLALLVRHHLGVTGFMLGHILVVVLICTQIAARRRAGADTTMLALAALATLCVGPLGPIGALCAVVVAPARAGTTRLLAAWYERIAHSVQTDPVTQLCDMVAIGRSVDLGGPPPVSFCTVMSYGSLGERQALLGLIARNFDVEYLPALKIALTSPEPVIRVQAAAVATRVQAALAAIVRRWTEAARRPVQPIDAMGGVVELQACLASGLIEATDRAAAEATLAGLRLLAADASTAPGFEQRLLSARGNPRQLSAILAFEELLVAKRRFKDLRNWRRLRRTGQMPQYRLRKSTVRRRSHPPRPLEVAA